MRQFRLMGFLNLRANLQNSLLAAFMVAMPNIILKLLAIKYIEDKGFFYIYGNILAGKFFIPNYILYFLIAYIIIMPILKMGSLRYFARPKKDIEKPLYDLIYFLKKPIKAYLSIILVLLINAIYLLIPALVILYLFKYHYIMVLQYLQIISFIITAIVIYVQVKFFNLLYILSSDDDMTYLEAFKKSIKISKGQKLYILHMLVFFIFIALMVEFLSTPLIAIPIFGTFVSSIISLFISAWRSTTLGIMHYNMSNLEIPLDAKPDLILSKFKEAEFIKKFLSQYQGYEEENNDKEDALNEETKENKGEENHNYNENDKEE